MGNSSTGLVGGTSSGVTAFAIVVLMHLAGVFGWPNFTAEVAGAYIGVAGYLIGIATHILSKDIK